MAGSVKRDQFGTLGKFERKLRLVVRRSFRSLISALPLREEEADGLSLDQIVFGLELSPDHVPIPRAYKLMKAVVQAVFRGFAEKRAHLQELISSAKQI